MSTPIADDPQLTALARGGPRFITEPTVDENGSLAGFYRDVASAQLGGPVRNPDLSSAMLTAVAPPIAVANAVRAIREYCDYTTELSGGHGAVREVCELVLASREFNK